MNKQLLLALGAVALAATQADAQRLKDGYVRFPESTMLHDYVSQWNTSSRAITVNGSSWEDEEFFTSRVKPRDLVTSTALNIYDFGEFAGRRALWWVPIGSPATQALPNANFDEEAFSMWSYLHHFGTWTCPFGWSVGAMSDIAHKNGVAVSGVASIPNAALSGDWLTSMTSLGNSYKSKADNLGKFLYYHGVDGLGYNSEFSSSQSIITNLRSMHANLMKYMKGKNAIFENIWYDGTNESGSISFDSFLSGKTGIYQNSSIFSNYNWVNTGSMASAVNRANEQSDANGVARGPWWNYAGMDQQGGQPKSGDNYPTLKNYKWSMGWWGAHSYNMFWEGRAAAGSSLDAIQQGYLKNIEQFFGNGPRNPAIKKTITTVRAHRPSDNYHGASAFINERSTLKFDLAKEPMMSFLNLGVGKFFNWEGERVSDTEWYSIGFQDYLPTWRFWTAPKWLQKTVTEGSTSLNVGFTFDDAYMGGSCLQIEGTATDEYLHLFKTDLSNADGKKLVVTYKLLEGEGELTVCGAGINGEDQEWQDYNTYKVLKLSDCEAAKDVSFVGTPNGGWITKEITLTDGFLDANFENNVNGGALGLRISKAKNLKVLIGQFSVRVNQQYAAPSAPKVKSSKILANVYTGVDGKIFWTMDDDAAWKAGTPKYNSDVNTSCFRLWAQEEGGEPQFMGVTTSWAAVIFRAPNTNSSKKIRFGVSAVAIDYRSESAVSWGDYLSKGSYTEVDDVALDKSTIKPNEGFRMYYVDGNHSSSTWTLKDKDGKTVASGTGTYLEVPDGLPEVGGYDLVLNAGKSNERTYGYFVQVSDESVGALPQIYSIIRDGAEVTEDGVPTTITLDKTVNLAYTGRKADGNASRALALNSRYIGTSVANMGLANTSNQPFSIAGWFYFSSIPDKEWNFMNVSNKTASWPQNTWGWAWNHGYADGSIECVFRGAASDGGSPGELHYNFPDTKLSGGAWTHIAWTCDYNNGFRCQLWINGVLQKSRIYQYATGNNDSSCRSGLGYTRQSDGSKLGNTDGTNYYVNGQSYAIASTDYLYFGGAAHQGAAIDGVVDDFQVWNKAMDANDVKQSMAGLDPDNLPSNVLCLWDFETDADSNYEFHGVGQKSGATAWSYDIDYIDNNPEKGGTYAYKPPMYAPGCPFLSGTAYPIVTTATWEDTQSRHTTFTKAAASRSAVFTDAAEGGSVDVKFESTGDHYITLKLENSYGTSMANFPMFEVNPEPTAIDGIDANGEGLKTYTVDRTFFLEFAESGNYTVSVFNTAGMLTAQETLGAAAGEVGRVELGATGIYLIRIEKDGRVIRTIKVAAR